jgi:hypothetical protein
MVDFKVWQCSVFRFFSTACLAAEPFAQAGRADKQCAGLLKSFRIHLTARCFLE